TIKNVFTKGRYYKGEAYPAGGCKRLGIPPVLFTDGPRGIVMGKCTCFPVSMLRGAAFDDELEYEIGQVMAKEASSFGANLFAGVCINLLRNPKWGRAQETYGEDPYLLGRMGSALTRAMQENGIIACPKHYALNSIEDLRFSVDARADERTLRDVYLPHFKKCIDAGAMSIMGAYNKVNGTYACENKELLTDILRGEWDFQGFTLSDFVYGIYDSARSVKAGMDVEMPYTFRYSNLKSKIKKGELTEEDIDRSVLGILKALIKTVPLQKTYPKSVIMSPEHTSLSRKAAGKGTVLLKNKDNTLPIVSGRKIAVVGRYADKINVGDHGSSNVYSPYTVTPYEGIKKRFGENNVKVYNGCDPEKALKAAENCDYVVICVGSDYRQEGEFLVNLGNVKTKPDSSGGDRVSLSIPSEDEALIKALSNKGKKLIVNMMGGSAYVITAWEELSDSILFSFYSGLEGGNALADILSGDVNPGGKLPFTVAEKESDYPSFLRIEDKTREIDYGYYHGYTLFDKKNISPRFPFGFGLSYTDFDIFNFSVSRNDREIIVSADIKNTGKYDGDEVLQVYFSSENKEADRPVKLLKGFKRVSVRTGETVRVSVITDTEDLKFYNEASKRMELDGSYVIYAGNSSRDVKEIGRISF
ncbi:MAG: glycoside hydrolase family 3 C-terminal domain-containing protein, partial [Clostridia bacterium]|nr:glycoside hydrolase family 3 C-terminal domain-containing protein [Clostridia bacterium]